MNNKNIIVTDKNSKVSSNSTQSGSFNSIVPTSLKEQTDSLRLTVRNMIKAGISVPDAYVNFVRETDPGINDDTIIINSNSPLFKIKGLDDDGNVDIQVKKQLEIKKGNKSILVDENELKEVIERSKKVKIELINKEKNDKDDKLFRYCIQSKNAYEIRLSIIEDAIDFLKISNDCDRSTQRVMEVANEFYKFISNSQNK